MENILNSLAVGEKNGCNCGVVTQLYGLGNKRPGDSVWSFHLFLSEAQFSFLENL